MESTAPVPPTNTANTFGCGINTNAIINGDLVVWLRVNVHFVVRDNNCDGLTDANSSNNRLTTEQAIAMAKTLIHRANSFATSMDGNGQLNQAFHGATVTGVQPTLFRFVLDHIFFKCDDSPIPVSGITSLRNRFNNSESTDALNLVVGRVTTFTGPACGFAPFANEYAVIADHQGQNIIHEFGHAFNLHHTFQGNNILSDGCDDTWHILQNQYSFVPVDGTPAVQVNRYEKWCNDSAPMKDLNNDGTPDNLCVQTPGLVENTHYCCDNNFRNNNCMSYGLPARKPSESCMTPSQMRRAVNNILDSKCNYLEIVNPPCPPTAAVIATLPTLDLSEPNCIVRLLMGSSMNVNQYRYVIQQRNSNGAFEDILYGNWENNPPNELKVGFGNGHFSKGADLLLPSLNSGEEYRLRLETVNDCGGSDEQTITFEGSGCETSLPPGGGGGALTIGGAYPNPVTNKMYVEVTIKEPTDLKIYTVGTNARAGNTEPTRVRGMATRFAVGDHRIQIPGKYFSKGINYAFFHVKGEVVQVAIMKK